MYLPHYCTNRYNYTTNRYTLVEKVLPFNCSYYYINDDKPEAVKTLKVRK